MDGGKIHPIKWLLVRVKVQMMFWMGVWGWVGDKNGGQKKANEVAADGEEID